MVMEIKNNVKKAKKFSALSNRRLFATGWPSVSALYGTESLVFSSFQFNIPIGVEDDDEDNKSAPLSANATPNHTYNSMQTGGSIEATIPPGNIPADKSIAAKAWSGFDAKYMKPLLTHSNPTLMETLPDCCGECLGFLKVI